MSIQTGMMNKLLYRLALALALAIPAAVFAQIVNPAFVQNGTGATARTYLDKGRDVVSVTDYQNGTTCDAAFAAALTYAATAGADVMLPAETCALTNSRTVPANVALRFNGGIFSIAVTKTLTINGAIKADTRQIFSGAGTVAIGNLVPEVYPEWWGAARNGVTDDTAALAAALATGRNVQLQNGIYGTTGGLTLSTYGQKLRGRGLTDIINTPAAGTTLKKLSGTADTLTIPIYTIGTEVANIGFNQNALGGSAIVTGGHQGIIRDVEFANQGGTSYALKISGSNLSHYSDIRCTGTLYGCILADKHPTALYSSYYSDFRGIAIVGTVSAYAIRINWATGLRFYDVFTYSPIYINDQVDDVQFLGLRAELSSVTNVLFADANTGGPVTNIVIKGGRMNALVDQGAQPFVKIAKATKVTVSDISFVDAFSAAERPYILLDAAHGATIDDLVMLNQSGNVHRAVSTQGGAISNGVKISNLYDVGNASKITINALLGNATVDTANLPVILQTGSGGVALLNTTGTITTNGTLNTEIARTSGSRASISSYAATTTGGTTAPVVTVEYIITGGVVTLAVPVNHFTSNATTYTLTGAPAAITPSSTKDFLCPAQDNSLPHVAAVCRMSSGGVLIFFRDADTDAFTAAGTKGNNAFAASYVLD